MCKLCNQNAVESEYHFILCCSKYRCIRSKYIGNCSWPTVQKFILLMSTKSKKCMYNLAKYIKESLCLRQNALENLTILWSLCNILLCSLLYVYEISLNRNCICIYVYDCLCHKFYVFVNGQRQIFCRLLINWNWNC